MVTRAKPDTRPYLLHDTVVTGLCVRVQPSGVKSFLLRWGRSGITTFKPRFPSLTLDAARDLAKKKIGEIVEQGAPSGLRPKGATGDVRTFGEFIDKRYAPVIADRKAHAATIAAIKSVFKDWLSKPLRSISYLDVERLKAQRLKGDADNDIRPAKPATVNRDLDRIRAALNAAIKLGLIDRNPVPDVKRLKVDNNRVRYLTPDEEQRLRKALLDREKERRQARKSANKRLEQRHDEPRHLWAKEEYTDHLMPLVLLALNTGLRRGELLGLTWESVDLHRRQLTVAAHTAKSGKVRHIPLNAEALAALTRWKAQGSGVGAIFPGGSGKGLTHTKRSWEGLLERAALTDFRFHDLRHHFASRLAMSGVDLYVVKELLGHSDFALTSRYAHLSDEHKAAAVAKLGAKR
jgi:integrase